MKSFICFSQMIAPEVHLSDSKHSTNKQLYLKKNYIQVISFAQVLKSKYIKLRFSFNTEHGSIILIPVRLSFVFGPHIATVPMYVCNESTHIAIILQQYIKNVTSKIGGHKCLDPAYKIRLIDIKGFSF